MKTSDSIAAIAPALVLALSEIEGAPKTAVNDAFKKGNKEGSKYATLGDAIDASKAILAKNGITSMQGLGTINNGHPPRNNQ